MNFKFYDRCHNLTLELITVKTEIERLTVREKEIKNILKSIVCGFLEFPEATVYCIDFKGSESLPRKNTLEYIQKKFGEEMAKEIDAQCTKKGRSSKVICVKRRGNRNF